MSRTNTTVIRALCVEKTTGRRGQQQLWVHLDLVCGHPMVRRGARSAASKVRRRLALHEAEIRWEFMGGKQAGRPRPPLPLDLNEEDLAPPPRRVRCPACARGEAPPYVTEVWSLDNLPALED